MLVIVTSFFVAYISNGQPMREPRPGGGGATGTNDQAAAAHQDMMSLR